MDTALELFSEVRPFAGASGSCSDVQALSFINRSRKLLWNKTDYPEIMDYVAICCAPDCFYLPSAYKKIVLAWLGDDPISVGNEWYISVPGAGMPSKTSSCHQRISQIGGFHVTFQNYETAPYQIAIQAEDAADIGTDITIFAQDLYGTKRKETLTLTNPPARALSAGFYKDVIAVIKPRTSGRIRLYAQSGTISTLLAVYQPYDRNPQFKKYAIQGGKNKKLTVYAKKSYFDLIDPIELVEFPIEAIKFASMALVAQADRDTQGYVNYLGLAVSELNRDITDEEAPTASPMRFFHSDNVRPLIQF